MNLKKILGILMALLLLSLTACGGMKTGTENTDQLPEDSVPVTEGSGDEGDTFDIKEDDHTVVITIANTIQVYTHDGVKVTGYTAYVDAGDEETARAVASAIDPNDSYYAGLGLKSVTTKGKYVVQEYNENGFPCETYEELHNLAEQYRQIQQ